MWLQNDCHSRIAKFPVNQRDGIIDVILSDCNADDACDATITEKNSDVMPSDCNGDDVCDDAINYFVDSEEESIEINNNENETIEVESKKSPKKSGRKSLFGGPSEETFFTL